MVVTSSHEITKNLANWMALKMAYWTSMNINWTNVKPTLSNECMDGLFGAFILLKVHTKTYTPTSNDHETRHEK